MALNGRLPASQLAPIPGGRLRRDAAAAWNDLVDAAHRDGVTIRPAGPVSSYRTYVAQVHFWNLYVAGGNPAAHPGTSNHGWGLAVDVANLTGREWAWMARNAHRFGFSHDEGARVGEPWHYRYVGGYTPKPADPLTHKERALVSELGRIRAQARRHGWGKPGSYYRRRGAAIKVWLRAQMGRIRHAAEHEHAGWKHADRLTRYRLLKQAYLDR